MKPVSTICVLICLSVGYALANEATTPEIDRDVWSVVSRTVVESDIEGMAATYHPDAVLVSNNGTVPIAKQLAKWGEDMVEAKKIGSSASVSFRFTSRRDDKETAFETGMFKYTVIESSGAESSYRVPFEALLVKKGGKWLMLMERQLEAVDEAAWAALASEE
jgi:ketosteroid isomerase-like protein